MSGVFDFCSSERRLREREKTSESTNTHTRWGWMIASILVGKGGGGARAGGKIEVVTLEREAFLKRPPGSFLLSLDSSSSLDFSSQTRLWILPERH